MTGILYVLGLLVVAMALLMLSYRYLHMLQLETYEVKFYLKWVHKNKKRSIRPLLFVFLAAVVGQIVLAAVPATRDYSFWLGMAVLILAVIAAFVKMKREPVKKDLVVTARVRRLMTALLIFLWAGCLLSYLLGGAAGDLLGGTVYAFAAPVLVSLWVLLLPYIVALAAWFMQPFEKMVKRKFFRQAERRLASFENMIKIGITGSFGKTSTKFILGTILAERYDVKVTPHSYNTPMGVAKVIREELTGREEIFVAEMGAKGVGEIKEMCDLVHPRYGLLTSVGRQHMDTFGTLENIQATKYELIEALPADGVGFFPADSEPCLSLYDKTEHVEKVLFGFDGAGRKLDVTARDVTVGPFGSRFTLVMGEEEISCETRILGRHNIGNILGCAAVARALGLTPEEIARGIAKIEPVEHRLQMLPTNNGLTVIDDAFNASPSGVRAAMDVISGFPGRKIVITPGLIEQGPEEDAENEKFGRLMAHAADYAILVGPSHTRPIAEGLLKEGFPEDHIIVVSSLDEATARLSGITRAGDCVLFENDLPDLYNE
jgi:UDP-N-acetylmuramoyl-tripeptide--D-alanyl-D-alanine ligase